MISPHSSFMSESAWIHPSWKAQHPKASHPLQILLDEAYLFPPIYEEFENVSQSTHCFPSPDSQHTTRLCKLLEKAHAVQINIDSWFNGFQKWYNRDWNQDNAMAEPQIHQTTFPQWDNKDADPSEHHLGKAFSVAYIFADFSIATSYIFYEAIQICIDEFIHDMNGKMARLNTNSRSNGLAGQDEVDMQSPSNEHPRSILCMKESLAALRASVNQPNTFFVQTTRLSAR